jgi:SAM-dependent methyltransferase
MTEAEILERLATYNFYHTIRLTDRISTPGWKIVEPLVEMTLRNLRTLDLKGKKVLDIGCRDGVFCFEAERLGAAEIVGIDNDPSRGAHEFLVPFLKSRVRLEELNLLDLKPETYGKFDVVIFPGVLYHLRYPFWGLKLVRDVLTDGGMLVLETAVLVDDNRLPLLYCPIGSESPYEPTSCTFYNTKGLMDTLQSLGLLVQHVEYLNPHTHPRRGPAGRQALQAVPGAAPPLGPPLIDRATFICQMTPSAIDAAVARYWDGTHRIHTEQQGVINAAARREDGVPLQTS